MNYRTSDAAAGTGARAGDDAESVAFAGAAVFLNGTAAFLAGAEASGR